MFVCLLYSYLCSDWNYEMYVSGIDLTLSTAHLCTHTNLGLARLYIRGVTNRRTRGVTNRRTRGVTNRRTRRVTTNEYAE